MTILLDFQSAESKDQKTTFISEKTTHQIRRASANDDAMKSRLSEDESNDSAFADNGKYCCWAILFHTFCPQIKRIFSTICPFDEIFTLGRLWFPQNRIYGVGLNRVSLQSTRPKTIHWAEVLKTGFYIVFFFVFIIFFCIIV